jgi:mannosyl-3-phosphoglycerate phosphatase
VNGGSGAAPAGLLVATDLDGCLLDEATYEFEAARPALERLAREGVPLVLATSKTRHEVAPLRDALGAAAVIVENGGALLLAAGSPGTNGTGVSSVVLGQARDVLVRALREIAVETGAGVRSFASMGPGEVALLTGLDPESAALAQRREYDEPFLLPDEDRAAAVAAAAGARGLRVTRGGRFWHLTGDTDKGRALLTLLEIYADRGRRYSTVALGDSPNDLPLLLAADRPIVVPRPGGAVDATLRRELAGAERAPHPGPEGWNAAVLAVLEGGRLAAVSNGA